MCHIQYGGIITCTGKSKKLVGMVHLILLLLSYCREELLGFTKTPQLDQ